MQVNDDDGKFPIKSEEICMIENQKMCNCKAMKMTFYTQTTPIRNGGENNMHFTFVDKRTMVKKKKKKIYKRRQAYLTSRPLLETLNIEARKCQTLEQFITQDWKEELWNAIEHEGGEKT